MAARVTSLEEIRIASPCSASWEEMRGNDRVRFCNHCRLHVYNLSSMSRQEALALVAQKEERLCVQFYRRSDGTVITRDCPVGLRTARRAAKHAGLFLITGMAAVLMLVFGESGNSGDKRGQGKNLASLADYEPFATILNWINPKPPKPKPTNPPIAYPYYIGGRMQ
jgi:hypothetical protein